MDLGFNSDNQYNMRLNLGKRVSADLWFKQNHNLLLEKGEVRIGDQLGKASAKMNNEVKVVAKLEQFNYEDWQKTFDLNPSSSSSTLLKHINAFDVQLHEFKFATQDLSNIHIWAKKQNEQSWSITLQQKDIAGRFSYTEGNIAKIMGRLDYLNLKRDSLLKENSNYHMKPIDIPQLDLTIGNLKLGETNLGQVYLNSQSSNHRWHLTQGTISSPAYQAEIQGDWIQSKEKNNSNFQTFVKIKNLAQGLENAGISPVVEAYDGQIKLNLKWNKDLQDFSLSRVYGEMFIQLQDGQITHLSPETEEKLGLGKLLSILSLQTIPRRLKLDFSDLSNKGYTFDIFKGNFTIAAGKMTTSDAYIDGPVAYASMKGDLDLVKQQYDLDLHVSPHITASLPVVATIAGGPIAGMAAWVASKIINQGMQKVTGYTYKISGPWDNPILQQVNIYKKKMQE